MAELSRKQRIYAVLEVFLLPIGLTLAVVGAMSDDARFVVVGLILCGLSIIDSAVVRPFLIGREQAQRRDETPDRR
jgi:membrane protein implicated in regulation of membrane protease activity